MNALKSMRTKAVIAMFATGLVAGAAFAASGSTVTVKLPESVSVGKATLASGQYTVSESFIAGGLSMFVFRSENGDATTAVGRRIAEPSADQKTEVVLSNEGGSLHIDKMFIEGDGAGYQFDEAKNK